eukprot:9496799-Pyramimonas_sp.AAC.1
MDNSKASAPGGRVNRTLPARTKTSCGWSYPARFNSSRGNAVPATQEYPSWEPPGRGSQSGVS